MAHTPCVNCRAKHQKCDRKRPACTRCQAKGLTCTLAPRKSLFRHGSTARFEARLAHNQPWVNSRPRNWMPSPDSCEQSPHIASPHLGNTASSTAQISENVVPLPIESKQSGVIRGEPWIPNLHRNDSHNYRAPFLSIQESCLLRYFIEELSPWFDHCDELKHFQRVVPQRAQCSSALRNAIFAVSARHLVRLPQYKTPQGVLYQGQLLTDLKHTTAVEYMLKCIPDLIKFPGIGDPVEQENLMAATVILRQYEEMEEHVEEDGSGANEHANFLDITQKIIDTMISSRLQQSLASAAYWIAIRQEVYYALTRERAPHMRFGPEDWRNASVANTMIMFASEVAKWHWGGKATAEWERLRLRQQQLVHDHEHRLLPILARKADRSKGELFPTVWYATDDQVTAVQHLELGRMILVAEDPHLEYTPRSVSRKAEAQVRSIVLSICGIALNHLRCQPALVNAVIAISLYGEYFTEPEERDELMKILDRTRDLRSWPMQEPYRRFRDRGDAMPSVSYT